MSGQSQPDGGLAALAKDWSCDSTCRASTSRGLPSHSSGDFDTDSHSYASRCSCCSARDYVSDHCSKPLSIADSTTKLRRSKWMNFKNYVKNHFKRKGKKTKAENGKENDVSPVPVEKDSIHKIETFSHEFVAFTQIYLPRTCEYLKRREVGYQLPTDDLDQALTSATMDVSPVNSSAKCGSDFSIERILRSESESSRGERSEAPSWLCCTRYQPPRLPRTASSACRVRRSGRHARVPFTVAQAAALEAAYARAPYLAPPALRALAAALQLRDDRIKIWFQNRRARERREKSSIITPPREVALPATALSRSQGLLGIATTTGLAWHRPTGSPSDINEAESSACYNDRYLQFDDTTDSPRDLRVSPVTLATSHLMRDEDYNDDRPYTPLDVENID